MDRFLSDCESGREAGSYVAAELTDIPFRPHSFDLAVCAHFLSIYSEQLSSRLQFDAIRALIRVAKEVRLFPLLGLRGVPTRHIDAVTSELRGDRFQACSEVVDNEFQRGGKPAHEGVAMTAREASGDSTRADGDVRLIDVSHTVEDGLVTYRGLPAPIICDYLSREESRRRYAEDTQFQIGKIEMVANTGTYVDSPFHRYADGKDLSQLPLSSLADLPIVLVKCRGQRIDASFFAGLDVQGKAVLVETGWSRHWRTDAYFQGHPFLTEDAATLLRDQGATLVGIDSLNIDDTHDGRRPVHSTLLAADIPIVEHLTNLAALPEKACRFFAVPVKVKAFGTFPVRAFVQVEN